MLRKACDLSESCVCLLGDS
uniref:Uncharacterized protein n=1 Tax=Arundo donax TaxID=35708 RepID=A0A0A9E3C5_ARUDO